MSKIRAASCGTAYDSAPQVTDAGSRTWITRGANFVVAISEVKAGAVLARDTNPDEYVVLLSGTGATIRAGNDSIAVADESLTIVPPGASNVIAAGDGRIVRVFSNQATDMAAAAATAFIVFLFYFIYEAQKDRRSFQNVHACISQAIT